MKRAFAARLLGFAGLPFLSLVAPFLALPVIARVGGVEGWAAVNLGQALGTYAATFASLGWSLNGPNRISRASEERRPRIYAESLQTRLLALVAVLPVAAIAAAAVIPAAGPVRALSAMMCCAVAMSALSPSWFAIGLGRPGLIAKYDVIPRVIGILAALLLLLLTHQIVAYPVCLIIATLTGVLLFSRRINKAGSKSYVAWRTVPALLWKERSSGATSIIAGAYSTAPLTVLGLVAPLGQLASFSSADRIYRLGLYGVQVFGNAFQGWVGETVTDQTDRPTLSRRMRAALAVHVLLGMVGLLVLGLLGPVISAVLFGAQVAASSEVCWLYGIAYLCIAVNTTTGKHILVPLGGIHSVLVSGVAGAVCGLALMAILGTLAGGPGVAAGFAASEAAVVVVQVVAIARTIKGRPQTSGADPSRP